MSGESSVRVAEPIHTRSPATRRAWIVAVSRSHGDIRTEAFIEARPARSGTRSARRSNSDRVQRASRLYPRLAPTSEWDVAAGHAIVTRGRRQDHRCEGRACVLASGRRLYRARFIAWGDPSAAC